MADWEDIKSGTFFTPDLTPLPLNGLYDGGACFLVMRGPSLWDLDCRPLRLVRTLGANLSPCHFRPDLWLHCDQPRKFPFEIWQDPLITKFVPLKYLSNRQNQRLREKVDGGMRLLDLVPADMPNVIGYRRNCTFDPEKVLSYDSVNWGNKHKETGFRVVKSVLFAAVFLANHLGFRRLYLVGCDCPQAMRLYQRVNDMFTAFMPHRGDLDLYNCTPESGLTAVPQMPLAEAIDRESCVSVD